MRRATIVALLLLVLSVGGVCFAASGVYEAHDQVTLTEDVLYGDRSAADGLAVDLHTTYADHLFWDTTYVLGAEPVIDTQYAFYASQQDEEWPVEYSGVDLSVTLYAGGYFAAIANENEEETAIKRLYRELAEKAGPGKKVSETVFVKDYFDYYPLSGSLNVPGTEIYWSGYDEDEGDYDPLNDPGTELYAVRRLQEYFRIPVQEEEQIAVELETIDNGNICSYGLSTRKDFFTMRTVGTLTQEACYFTFDAHTVKGEIVDLSEIPGGYGIYRLPYEEDRRDENHGKVCSVDADALEMVYPLDPEITPVCLCVNPEQTKLLLHAVEGDEYILTVIDIETMAALQKLKIEGEPEEIYDEGGYLAILLSDGRLAVVAVSDSGDYELRLICDVSPDELENTLFWRVPAFDFDGERLAVVGQPLDKYGRYYDSCNFFLAVYEPSGLAYYGEYWNSLSAGSDWEVTCRGRSDPLAVSWNAEP